MKNKIIGVIIVIIFFVGLYGGYATFKKVTTPKKTHYHAGFVVYKNDKKIDFSDSKYMKLEPCTNEKKHEDSGEEIQLERAHLHDLVGDIVHVEREGAYWRDLFTNINYKIDYSRVIAYMNGNKIKNFENQKIQPYDSLVVLIGSSANSHLKDAVTKKYIKKKAKISAGCGE